MVTVYLGVESAHKAWVGVQKTGYTARKKKDRHVVCVFYLHLCFVSAFTTKMNKVCNVKNSQPVDSIVLLLRDANWEKAEAAKWARRSDKMMSFGGGARNWLR